MPAMSLAHLFVITAVISMGSGAYDDDLNCMVCEAVIQELEKGIAAVDPKKVIELGGRLEADGTRTVIKKQYRRSQVFLTELLDSICEKMDDYVQGHWKDTGRKGLLQLIVDGQMNPRMPDFEIFQDSNLNKGVKDYCQTIVEEQDDELMAFLSEERKEEDPSHWFCHHQTDLCPQHVHNKEEL